MNNTCCIALGVDEQADDGRAICGKPAVDWADIRGGDGKQFRVYFCTNHLYHREMILEMHGAELPFNPFND